jgi:hemin uptake protein HemP
MPAPPPDPPPRRLELAELLRGARCLEIVHAGRVYRLRLTATGKLILTA